MKPKMLGTELSVLLNLFGGSYTFKVTNIIKNKISMYDKMKRTEYSINWQFNGKLNSYGFRLIQKGALLSSIVFI